MRSLLIIALFLFSISFYLPAQAQPPLWSNDLGPALEMVSNCDDCEETINFPFPVPFNGSSFTMAAVGSNGCIQLGGLGTTGYIDYEYWEYMEEFLADSNPDNPIICPFESDLDTEGDDDGCGSIHYNNSGNPLIITWNNVCAHNDDFIEISSQILLYQDGRIVINLNGIGVGQDLVNLDEGIIVGVTPSNLEWDGEPFVPGDPGPVNLNQGVFDFGPTAYERWCDNIANSCGTNGSDTGLPGPVNNAFDLDFWSICYSPTVEGFSISSGFEGESFNCGEAFLANVPTLSEWGLIAMAAILGVVGFIVVRRRKATA